jgi:hypothetical protein
MARRLVDPDVEEASWGWATQQCLKKTLKAWYDYFCYCRKPVWT